jgi:dihydrofolate reductase
MIVSLIFAASDNDVISRDGHTPWFVGGEMLIFKRVTMGAPLIMGRRTYEEPKAYKSRPRLLPGRLNVILTSNRDYEVAEGGVVAHSLEEALALEEVRQAPEVFIIGGKQLFESALPLAARVYLTRVHLKVDGGVSFRFDQTGWKLISTKHFEKDHSQKRPYSFDFQIWERAK